MAVTRDEFRSMRWCRSMVGEEYGKVFCWGGHPDTKVRLYNVTRSLILPCWVLIPGAFREISKYPVPVTSSICHRHTWSQYLSNTPPTPAFKFVSPLISSRLRGPVVVQYARSRTEPLRRHIRSARAFSSVPMEVAVSWHALSTSTSLQNPRVAWHAISC